MIRHISKASLFSAIAILAFKYVPDARAEVAELENARIVVQENLQELPDVNVTTSEDITEVEDEREIPLLEEESSVGAAKTSTVDRPPIESTPKRGELLSRDPVLAAARLPLTYMQANVPFLTRRNIIFFGRLELDGTNYNGGVLDTDSGFDIRRFRLGIAGLFRSLPGWNYKLEVDLTDGENNLSDFYLSHRSEKWGTFRIGNQKVAQTLSGQTSSLSNTFMERPLPVLAFTQNRRIGLGWDTHLRKLGANVTVFSEDPNKNIGSKGWAARGYYNPTRDRLQVLHVGASVMQLISDADARIRARPESMMTNTRLVDTGTSPDIDSLSVLGLELAGSRGSMTFKSEFYATKWARSDTSKDPRFTGWYAQAAWFVTGELAQYREGKFIRPNIRNDSGAIEVALRFSSVDLNDRDIQGGTEQNLTLGLNWYSKTHWRFMSNVIRVKAEGGPHGKQDSWIVQFRAQYYF